MAFSADGKFALSGSEDTTMRLWNMETFLDIYTFEGHSAGLRSVVFNPDGLGIASGGRDAHIILWRLPLENEALTEWIYANRYTRALSSGEEQTYCVSCTIEATRTATTGTSTP